MEQIPVLHATPSDRTPDSGPRRHGGPLVLLLALMATLSMAFAVGLGYEFNRPTIGISGAILFGLVAAWLWSRLWLSRKPIGSMLRSHSVLTGVLGFDLVCTCRGVAATAFFCPDRITGGDSLEALVFLENYTSRQRIARLKVGPHVDLGLFEPRVVQLHLAAGQATVFRLPLRVDANARCGTHDLPILLRVLATTGFGSFLPGTRHHFYDAWRVWFATPFTVETACERPSLTTEVPPPSYHTLASVSDSVPHLDVVGLLASAASRRSDIQPR